MIQPSSFIALDSVLNTIEIFSYITSLKMNSSNKVIWIEQKRHSIDRVKVPFENFIFQFARHQLDGGYKRNGQD